MGFDNNPTGNSRTLGQNACFPDLVKHGERSMVFFHHHHHQSYPCSRPLTSSTQTDLTKTSAPQKQSCSFRLKESNICILLLPYSSSKHHTRLLLFWFRVEGASLYNPHPVGLVLVWSLCLAAVAGISLPLLFQPNPIRINRLPTTQVHLLSAPESNS